MSHRFSPRVWPLLVSLLVISGVRAAEPMPIQTGKGHRFLCADYMGKLAIVKADGQIEWEYPAHHCNELWALPNGNILFSSGDRVLEVTREKKVVFQYVGSLVTTKDKASNTTQSPSEIYACQRLANGNTFVGECNSGKLLEVDPSGKVVKEVPLLPPGTNAGHGYMRNARVLANGHYLVASASLQNVREFDEQGKVLLTIPVPGGAHSCVRLANGNTLISAGDGKGGSRVLETDPAGKTLWQVQNGDLPGLSLHYMTGFQRLANGHTVMTNWLGHGHFGKSAHIIEVTPAKEVVWTFADHKNFKTVASLQILDEPGDCTRGEVAH